MARNILNAFGGLQQNIKASRQERQVYQKERDKERKLAEDNRLQLKRDRFDLEKEKHDKIIELEKNMATQEDLAKTQSSMSDKIVQDLTAALWRNNAWNELSQVLN